MKRAFTLLELIVVITLLGLVFGLFFMFLNPAWNFRCFLREIAKG